MMEQFFPLPMIGCGTQIAQRPGTCLWFFASVGLCYLGEVFFHLSREVIQSFMYLKLPVAGHLTIFVTRTRRAFWSIRPAPILLAAVVGTQLIATLFAVFGIFMAPIGWGWALFIWGYALAWFLVNDRIKLAAYRVFDPQERGLLEKTQLSAKHQIDRKSVV